MKKNNVKTMIKNNFFMLKLVWNIKPSRIILSIVVNILNGVLNFLSQIFLLHYVINCVVNNQPFNQVIFVAGCVLVYQALTISINAYYNAMYKNTSDNYIKERFQETLFYKALSIDMKDFDDPAFFNKYTRALSESNRRALQIVDWLGRLVGCSFTLFSVSFIIFSAEPSLVAIAILPFIIGLFIGPKQNKHNFKQSLQLTPLDRVNEYTRRTIYGTQYAKELRTTNIYNVLKDRFYKANVNRIRIIKQYAKKNTLFNATISITNQVVVYMGTIVFVAYKLVVAGTMILADAFVIIRSIWQISASLNELSRILIEFQEHSLYAQDIIVFMKYKPQIVSRGAARHISTLNSSIQLKNVTFRYPNEEKTALSNINLEIKKGEKIAVVGANGAGKSTLVKLILRLYEPTTGEILCDSNNVKEYDLNDYRNLFSTVFQDYKIFAMSILDNILCGYHVNDETISRALSLSGLDDEIKKIPQGINANVTKEFDKYGQVFSGGQEQKLVLARAFAKDAPVVIFDEPTRALDPIAEHDLFEKIFTLCTGKTVLFISHRLSAVSLSDRIIMMDHGTIIESGTHEQLMKNQGAYAELYQKQATNYIQDS